MLLLVVIRDMIIEALQKTRISIVKIKGLVKQIHYDRIWFDFLRAQRTCSAAREAMVLD